MKATGMCVEEYIVVQLVYQNILFCFRPEDAIPDFESVLKLNKDNACSHVNLGLIMMNHYGNYHRFLCNSGTFLFSSYCILEISHLLVQFYFRFYLLYFCQNNLLKLVDTSLGEHQLHLSQQV